MADEQFILYERDDKVAIITLDRTDARNAQHPPFLEQLDAAFCRGAADPEVRVIVLRANGPHFSAGHDIRYKKYDIDYDDGAASLYAWERENYLGMTRRWRDLPKPTIAAVQGKCIAGGLMLCWPCDLILASDDAQFSDPVVRMGVGGVEYHGHTWELGARKAKEMLFTGGFMDATEAHRLGMVNRVVPLAELEKQTLELASEIAEMDPFGLRMSKQAVNRTLDAQGQWQAMEAVFDMHHLCHAHSRLVNDGNAISGQTVDSMKKASKAS
ncbi:MAG: enoyl-CoA hydratase [Deltaproteobacteria bacterium]|nr:enoyl-CoA hydratase [Deltaproteobacteria bacterium]